MQEFLDLIVTTLRKWSDTLSDNVTSHSPLLAKLKSIGAIVLEDGGISLEENIESAENATFQWYYGYDTLNITPGNVFTSAVYSWKQANANVILSGLELRNNMGSKTRKYNLLASKMANAEHTMKNQVSAACFSDGTGSNGKEIGGLQLLISDNPATSIVGGIDASTNAFWRNQMYSFNSEVSVTNPTPAQMVAAMDQMWLRTVRNADKPTIILADANYYTLYSASTQNIKRISGETKIGDVSFPNIEYNGVPVIYDSNCPTNHMYFVNTDFLKLKVHKEANFVFDETRIPTNQDAKIYPMLFQGNLTCSNRNLQGVITA